MTNNLGIRYLVIGLFMGLSIWAIQANWPVSLGIDIRGGSILTYKVEHLEESSQAPKSRNAIMQHEIDDTITVISERINKEGVKDISVRQEGPDQVALYLEGMTKDQADQIRAKMTQVGQLLLPIVADTADRAPDGTPFNKQNFDKERADKLQAHFADASKPLFDPPSCFR